MNLQKKGCASHTDNDNLKNCYETYLIFGIISWYINLPHGPLIDKYNL